MVLSHNSFLIKRFSSWKKAKDFAGVETGKQSLNVYKKNLKYQTGYQVLKGSKIKVLWSGRAFSM